MIWIIAGAILFAVVGPPVLALAYVGMALPKCNRCNDRMADVETHMCPDGITPEPVEDSKEWPA